MIINKLFLDTFLLHLKNCEFVVLDADTFEKLFEGHCSYSRLKIYVNSDSIDSDLYNYYVDSFYVPMGSLLKIFVRHEKID